MSRKSQNPMRRYVGSLPSPGLFVTERSRDANGKRYRLGDLVCAAAWSAVPGMADVHHALVLGIYDDLVVVQYDVESPLKLTGTFDSGKAREFIVTGHVQSLLGRVAKIEAKAGRPS